MRLWGHRTAVSSLASTDRDNNNGSGDASLRGAASLRLSSRKRASTAVGGSSLTSNYHASSKIGIGETKRRLGNDISVALFT